MDTKMEGNYSQVLVEIAQILAIGYIRLKHRCLSNKNSLSLKKSLETEHQQTRKKREELKNWLPAPG